ncbi:hypothetical protein NC652_040026 [Populus alba x Populus x berolinensis]|nr:hypothetical protein NC652_040026 [Populus alba x Populus x berolinensis]
MRSTRTVQDVAVPAAPSFADSAEFRKHTLMHPTCLCCLLRTWSTILEIFILRT